MQHLTNLVLILPHSMIVTAKMEDLRLPALLALNITGGIAPLGLTQFVTNHSKLLRLHLCFGMLLGQTVVQERHLPKLRSLKFEVELMERDRIYTTLIRERRPHIEHISIYNLRTFRLDRYISQFQQQLRRLDLKTVPVGHGDFLLEDLRRSLKSFTALVEISVTIGGPLPSQSRARYYSTPNSIAELVRRSILLLQFIRSNYLT